MIILKGLKRDRMFNIRYYITEKNLLIRRLSSHLVFEDFGGLMSDFNSGVSRRSIPNKACRVSVEVAERGGTE